MGGGIDLLRLGQAIKLSGGGPREGLLPLGPGSNFPGLEWAKADPPRVKQYIT